MFGTQELHKELRFLACIEIGENTTVYDPDSSGCHALLCRYDIVAPALSELIHEVSSAGTSCCVGALIALSSVLHVPISSYYPPISSSFVAPLTVDIVGRGVDYYSRRIAVMWSTIGPTSGETININHVVPMINTPYHWPSNICFVPTVSKSGTTSEKIIQNTAHLVWKIYIFRFTNFVPFLHCRICLILLYICYVFVLFIHLYHLMYIGASDTCFSTDNLTWLVSGHVQDGFKTSSNSDIHVDISTRWLATDVLQERCSQTWFTGIIIKCSLGARSQV